MYDYTHTGYGQHANGKFRIMKSLIYTQKYCSNVIM